MIETNTEYDEFLRNRCPVEKTKQINSKDQVIQSDLLIP